MFKRILDELREHAPFTVIGAVSGIIMMILFSKMPNHLSYKLFYIFHPIHVALSGLVTASMYELKKCPTSRIHCNIPVLLIIGFVGSLGIATLSDSLIPFFGEKLLNMPHAEAHIGFIEEWPIVVPMAILGIAIAYFKPSTKFPHAGHVLLSTWASLFHILMAMGGGASWYTYIGVFFFLFIAVWLPCCISDIAFPLLFVKDPKDHIGHNH
ncbi:hypothetical protein ACFL0T_02140 [Candidatus Omnitrophota bacterium]